jgi:hypothetical protein
MQYWAIRETAGREPQSGPIYYTLFFAKTIFAESNQRVLTFSSSNFNGQEEEGHILSTTRWGCS